MNTPLILVLSQDKHPGRWDLVASQLEADGISRDRIQRIEGIDGSTKRRRHKGEESMRFMVYVRECGKAVDGVPLELDSHSAISMGWCMGLQLANWMGEPWVITLEDDAALPPGFINRVIEEVIPNAPDDWGVLNLGAPCFLPAKPVSPGLREPDIDELPPGAHCLAIRASAMRKLLQLFDSRRLPDWGPEALIHWLRHNKGLKLYCWDPTFGPGAEQFAFWSTTWDRQMVDGDLGWRSMYAGRPGKENMMGVNRSFEIPISGGREVKLTLPLDLMPQDMLDVRDWMERYGSNVVNEGKVSTTRDDEQGQAEVPEMITGPYGDPVPVSGVVSGEGVKMFGGDEQQLLDYQQQVRDALLLAGINTEEHARASIGQLTKITGLSLGDIKHAIHVLVTRGHLTPPTPLENAHYPTSDAQHLDEVEAAVIPLDAEPADRVKMAINRLNITGRAAAGAYIKEIMDLANVGAADTQAALDELKNTGYLGA